MTHDAVDHWQSVYSTKSPDEVSWYEARPQRSLELIRATGLPANAGIVDVGGGVSSLASQLLAAGYSDLTVADISAAALEEAQIQLGDRADSIRWVVADVRDHDFGRDFDLWHDRAVFHFMVNEDDRQAYVDVLLKALRPGGHLLLATFGPQGPEQCSGLPVARYDADQLHHALGDQFELISASLATHHTPSGRSQQFLHAHLRRLS